MGKTKRKINNKRKNQGVNYPTKKKSIDSEMSNDQFIKENNAKALKHLAEGKPGFFINGYYKNEEGAIQDPQANFYRPFCTEMEIERILNVNTAEDILLKIRADEVADNPRIQRVILKRQRVKKENWSLTDHFSKNEFETALSVLSEKDRLGFQHIPMGFVFSNEPNGSCIKTDFGNIIIVSEALKYFLFFMNIHFIKFNCSEVPNEVKIQALIIGIRTMLQTESLDFELDPRGKIPSDIEFINNEIVSLQLQFIILHEFAHHLLNHLDENNVIERNISGFNNTNDLKIFKNSINQEFEADIKAIEMMSTQEEFEFERVLYYALTFFIYIDVYEYVSNQLNPRISEIRTHPLPIDRIWNIYDSFKDSINITKEEIDDMIVFADQIKEMLEKHISYNIDVYETYGSLYLEEWREKILIDRIDY